MTFHSNERAPIHARVSVLRHSPLLGKRRPGLDLFLVPALSTVESGSRTRPRLPLLEMDRKSDMRRDERSDHGRICEVGCDAVPAPASGRQAPRSPTALIISSGASSSHRGREPGFSYEGSIAAPAARRRAPQ